MSARRRSGGWLHQFIEFVRGLVEAIRHVRSGGASTRRRAVRRAAAPPQKCPRCHQPVPHSGDWRDHLAH